MISVRWSRMLFAKCFNGVLICNGLHGGLCVLGRASVVCLRLMRMLAITVSPNRKLNSKQVRAGCGMLADRWAQGDMKGLGSHRLLLMRPFVSAVTGGSVRQQASVSHAATMVGTRRCYTAKISVNT